MRAQRRVASSVSIEAAFSSRFDGCVADKKQKEFRGFPRILYEKDSFSRPNSGGYGFAAEIWGVTAGKRLRVTFLNWVNCNSKFVLYEHLMNDLKTEVNLTGFQ